MRNAHRLFYLFNEGYCKTCISIASSSELDISTRIDYFTQAINIIETTTPEPPWICTLGDCLTLSDVDVKVNQGSAQISATLGVISSLPVKTKFHSFLISLSQSNKNMKHRESLEAARRKSFDQTVSSNLFLQRVSLTVRLDYQQDKSLAGANVEVKNTKSVIRRQDSHGKYRKISNISKSDFTKYFLAKDVVLTPGQNTITLMCKDCEPGLYKLGQVCGCLREGFELLSVGPHSKVNFEVVHIPPSVSLIPRNELLAGVKRSVFLRILSNSHEIVQGSKIRLRASFGLELQKTDCSEPLSRVVEIELPHVEPNSNLDIPIILYCHLPNIRDSSATIDHTIMVKSVWTEDEAFLHLSLTPVLSSKLVMHTAKLMKFLHVTVTSHSDHTPLRVHSASMVAVPPASVSLIPVNPPLDSVELVSDRKLGYMWKLDTDDSSESEPLKTEFVLQYQPLGDLSDDNHAYKCTFDINNYKTVYKVECCVEPGRGSEFCRVSTVCQLMLRVTRLVENTCETTSLMYEVLAEHNMWAVCGRTAGVLTLNEVNEQVVTLDVMPLINGYLPLPSVRLSKYIPANSRSSSGGRGAECHLRLEPFSPGQVYNISKGSQVHVISAASPQDT